ncbi:uncharacterized protein [Amphiura filiformis]|uniref:uncharacterized protein n=1 Tax=Amphiura filiformis TaxID=82378 RepID=UPI003B222231
MPTCIVKGCKNRPSDGSRNFHKFPKVNKYLLSKWIQALKLSEDFKPTYHIVCSEHFTSDDYFMGPSHISAGKRLKRLKYTAVPSLFQNPRTSITNSSFVNPRTSVTNSSFVNPRTSVTNSFLDNPRTSVTNSSLDNPRTSVTNSSLDNPRTSVTNSSLDNPRTSVTNSSLDNPRTSVTNSSLDNPRTSVTNSSFDNQRTSVTNSSFDNQRTSVTNSSFVITFWQHNSSETSAKTATARILKQNPRYKNCKSSMPRSHSYAKNPSSLRKKIKGLQQTVRRQKQKIATLTKALETLEEKQNIK